MFAIKKYWNIILFFLAMFLASEGNQADASGLFPRTIRSDLDTARYYQQDSTEHYSDPMTRCSVQALGAGMAFGGVMALDLVPASHAGWGERVGAKVLRICGPFVMAPTGAVIWCLGKIVDPLCYPVWKAEHSVAVKMFSWTADLVVAVGEVVWQVKYNPQDEVGFLKAVGVLMSTPSFKDIAQAREISIHAHEEFQSARSQGLQVQGLEFDLVERLINDYIDHGTILFNSSRISYYPLQTKDAVLSAKELQTSFNEISVEAMFSRVTDLTLARFPNYQYVPPSQAVLISDHGFELNEETPLRAE